MIGLLDVKLEMVYITTPKEDKIYPDEVDDIHSQASIDGHRSTGQEFDRTE